MITTKKLKQYFFLLGTIIIVMASCTPDDDELFQEENNPKPGAFTYSASLNGISWKGTTNVSTLVKDSTAFPPKLMNLNAQSADGKQLVISLSDVSSGVKGNAIALQTYTLSPSNPSNLKMEYLVNGNKLFTGKTGSVTISACDGIAKKISGTFSATLTNTAGDSLVIKNGLIKDLPYVVFE